MGELKEVEEYRRFTKPAELHKAVNTLKGIVAGITTDRQISEKARPRELDEGVEFGAARCDYLPPEYITFLMTDLGVLAPPSVSDELIKLYWWIVCWKCEETNELLT